MREKVGLGLRVGAITLDWFMSYAIASAISGGISQSHGRSLTILGIFFAEVSILTALQGASAGQKLMRLKVIRFSDGGQLAPLQVLIRTILLCLVVTAITYDENGRGLHERLSNSVLVRTL